jgi:toxin-antitoxin system PIN domain toxin
MPLADSNFWIALALSKHPFHDEARSWLAQQSSRDPVLFCRSTQQTFLRLLTTQAVCAPFGIPPLTNRVAWSTYESFQADDRISWTEEPAGLNARWQKFANRPTASPKLWMDAYLAAFAMEGGHQLVTIDKDFQQFKGINLHLLSKA